MGDPLSVTASIIAVLQLTGTVVKYLSDVKDGSKDRQTLLAEVTSTSGYLYSLKELVERPDSVENPLATVRQLAMTNGPLHQLKVALKQLESKLEPVVRQRRAVRALLWPFEKGEVQNILRKIEGQKSLFIIALQNDQCKLARAIENNLNEIRDDVQRTSIKVSEIQGHHMSQERKDIILWLSPLNFWSKQNELFDSRLIGTGEWFLEDKVFKDWLSSKQGTLWCPGIPGAGKTVLTSVVVNHLSLAFQQEDVGIAYIYCSHHDHEQQSAVNLIASLLQQLIQSQRVISNEVNTLYKRHIDKKTRPTLSECSKLLKAEVGTFSKVFLVIDALDECPELTGTSLLSEIGKLQPDINLLVTSRPVSTFGCEFKNHKRLEIHASNEDVKRYLENRIINEIRLGRHIRKDPTLQEAITSTIVKKVKGMFLLAQLHMDSLSKKHSCRDIRDTLQNLPNRIDDTYDEAMKRIGSQDEEDVKLANKVLSWITYTFRPITVKEIQHALAVNPHDLDIDEDALPDEEDLVSVCAGLVVIDQESKIIRLVHDTTREYFERVRADRFPDGHSNIARICIAYISFDAFTEGYCHSDKETEIRLHKYPLLPYAAQHWGDHTREFQDSDVNSQILGLLKHNLRLSSSIQVMQIPKYRYEGYSQQFVRGMTGLHVASSFGLYEVVCSLLEAGEVGAMDHSRRTALHLAARNGHEAVVQLLLDKGASIEAKDRFELTALHQAASSGHEAVVRLLLKMGADIEADDKDGETVLRKTALNGYKALMQLLIEKGANVNAKSRYGETALHRAASSGREAVVRLLLERGMDVKAKTRYGATALQLAKLRGNEAVAWLLEAAEQEAEEE